MSNDLTNSVAEFVKNNSKISETKKEVKVEFRTGDVREMLNQQGISPDMMNSVAETLGALGRAGYSYGIDKAVEAIKDNKVASVEDALKVKNVHVTIPTDLMAIDMVVSPFSTKDTRSPAQRNKASEEYVAEPILAGKYGSVKATGTINKMFPEEFTAERSAMVQDALSMLDI